jgi:hypothetical protein
MREFGEIDRDGVAFYTSSVIAAQEYHAAMQVRLLAAE